MAREMITVVLADGAVLREPAVIARRRDAAEVAPSGGVKESGIPRDGSKHGVDAWIDAIQVSLGGIER
jgi:hypothetical protein